MGYNPPLVGVFHLLISMLSICTAQLSEYKRHDLCFLSERLQYGYTRMEGNEEGNSFGCAKLCQLDDECIGFSFERGSYSIANNSHTPTNPNGYCYLHKEFLTNDQCIGDAVESHHRFYRKSQICLNGGSWNDELLKCECAGAESKPDIMIGPMCTARPRNCRDLSNRGFRPFTENVYLKHWPDYNQTIVLVLCAIAEDGGTKIRVARNARTTDVFNRTWEQYTNEFGDSTFYWIGLNLLYSILVSTAEPSTIYMEVYSKGANAYLGISEFYDVKLSNSSDGHRLSYSRVSLQETFAEHPDDFCWQFSNNTRFSTFDADNDDNETENCASLNGVGWWFGANCTSPCNLFGSQYRWYPMRRLVGPDYSLGQFRTPAMNIKDFARYFVHSIMEIHA